jgi:hypothetical protein
MAVSGFVSGKFHMSSKWKKIMSIVALCLFGTGRVLAQSSNGGGNTVNQYSRDGASREALKSSDVGNGLNRCKHDPTSSLPCAGTAVPEPRDVDQFWKGLISILTPARGYVLREQVEHAFNIHLTIVGTDADGRQVAEYKSSGGLPLSVQLDTYAVGSKKQVWQRDQGELNRARSILNISGGNFGCVSVPSAEKMLSDAGFSEQGSIIYRFVNLGRSITEFADPNRPTTITLYYGQPVFTRPCVLSIRVDAYK